MEDWISELVTRVWITKGCRFNASLRLAIQSHYSKVSIAIWSVTIIILSLKTVLQYESHLNSIYPNLALITIGLSALILVFSLIESGQNYSLKSSKLHDCAVEISNIYNKLIPLKQKKENAIDEILELQKEYHNVISKYDYNHRKIDYWQFKASYPDEFELSKFVALLILGYCYVSPRFLYLLLIVIPILISIWYLV